MNDKSPVGGGLHVHVMICVLINVSGVCVCVPVLGDASFLGLTSPDTHMLAKCFCLTRLETRTKESNRCAKFEGGIPLCAMKVSAGMCAPAPN